MDKYITEFDVIGTGRFPVDMLRYDRCMPADHGNVEVMMLTADPNERYREKGDDLERVIFRVRLATTHSKKKPDITFARWQSFGWSVDPNTIETRRIK